ncbi:MAG: DUF1552 domain-containing protein [Planctomycetota bacterium]
MNSSESSTSRRAFLRGASALVALPFLESFGHRPFVSAAQAVSSAAPKRMVFLGMGFGVTKEAWYPDVSAVGKDFEMPKVLKPLARHKDDITIVQNLYHQHSRDGHWGSTFWLTGANRFAVPGQSFHNTVSVDQVAAETLGKNTRFPSVQLSGSRLGSSSDGHGPGLSLAWNRQGKPVSSWQTPVSAFHRLFSNDKTPLAVRQRDLAERRSVLDTVLSDAKSVRRQVNKTDSDKIDEYLQSVREIELRLAKEEKWLGVTKKRPARVLAEPSKTLEGVDEIRMMYDLMVAAMQVDASRVFTYRMPGDTMLKSLGVNMSAHTMSHYAEGDRHAVSELRDRQHTLLLAEFIGKLKSFQQADGTTLFDSSCIVFGSNISTKHNLTNCPTLLSGGGAGVQQGRHLVMKDSRTPLCNLWLSLLRGVGIDSAAHGDSTGVIPELFSA